MTSLVIVGSFADPHVARVAEMLHEDVAILDVELLARSNYVLSDDIFEFDNGSRVYKFARDQPVRGWLRRLAPTDWQTGVVTDSRRFAERSAWLSLLSSFLRQPAATWLTKIDDAVRAENKLIVAHAARAASARMPWTVVTNDPSRIPGDADDLVVVKPLGPGHYVEGGEAYGIFASAVRIGDLDRRALGPAPFLVQEHLHAARHRRVATVGRHAWSAVLDATDRPLDWRRQASAHHSFEPEPVPGPLERDAVAVAANLRLGYSSQDWIETSDGEHVLVDVNPSGQWLFLPPEVSTPITHAISEWLMIDA